MNKASTKVQVFGLGQCSLDYLGRIDAYPLPDRKCEFTGLVAQGGGPVATAMVALARWGVFCAFAGVTGDDAFGEMIRESLAREGVDTDGLLSRTEATSQFAFIAYEPARARRTIFLQRPTGPPLRPEEIDLEKLRRSRVFHTDGLSIEAALSGARAARKAGVTVFLDGGAFREGMRELAGLSDWCIVSEDFARDLAGEDHPEEACRLLACLGPAVAGVTLGKRGYVALSGGTWVRKPAFPVQAVDTTGCGDVFHAGCIYGVLQGWPWEKTLAFAAWAAAMASRAVGGRTAIPSPAELQTAGYGVAGAAPRCRPGKKTVQR